jgi:hypothetical protein
MSCRCRSCNGTGTRLWPVGVAKWLPPRLEYIFGWPIVTPNYVPEVIELPCECTLGLPWLLYIR